MYAHCHCRHSSVLALFIFGFIVWPLASQGNGFSALCSVLRNGRSGVCGINFSDDVTGVIQSADSGMPVLYVGWQRNITA